MWHPALIVCWALWPLALLVSVFLPSLTLDSEPEARGRREAPRQVDLIGSEGHCLCDLRPGGKIRVGDRAYDATCVGSFLVKDTRVRVVGKDDFHWTVEPIDASEVDRLDAG